jgi:hypothetical protein
VVLVAASWVSPLPIFLMFWKLVFQFCGTETLSDEVLDPFEHFTFYTSCLYLVHELSPPNGVIVYHVVTYNEQFVD